MKLLGFWILSFISLMISAKSTVQEEPRIVCYYTNWSIYRPGNAKYGPENINPHLCTHLIYAFGGFTKNTLQPFDRHQDIVNRGYAKFNGLKMSNTNLKTLLSIGGWNEGSIRFSSLVGDASRRQTFIKNAIIYLRRNNFDGLDLDWQYPTFRDGGNLTDRGNYAQFVQELREEFDRESSTTEISRLLLTLAIPGRVHKINQGYDVVKLNQYLDWFNVLSFNYHDSSEPTRKHHAPLYSLEDGDESTVDFSVKHLINAGADREKLVIGIPAFGITVMFPKPGSTDDGTQGGENLAYYEICQNIKNNGNWTVMHPNDDVMGPYSYTDDQWISYDDENIARKKAQYAAKNGLGGIMFWTIDTDDFNGTCSGKPYPLIEAAKAGLFNAFGVKPTDPAENISTTTSQNRPNQTLTVNYDTTTNIRLEPPATPDPDSDFICEGEGFFSHPRDCKKYFWCSGSGSINLGIMTHQFICASDLVFNQQVSSCDHARNVICENNRTSTALTSRPQTTTSQSTTRLSTTQRTTILRTTMNRPTTTTTTPTFTYDDDGKENKDEIKNSELERDIEDPKVIKKLIDLIKKAGGLDKLQKHLKFSGENSSFYDKVLFQKPENRLVKIENTHKIKSDNEVINVIPKISNERRPIPQNSRLEKPQYVTIQKHRTSIKIVW